jgi:hypothetical protein
MANTGPRQGTIVHVIATPDRARWLTALLLLAVNSGWIVARPAALDYERLDGHTD